MNELRSWCCLIALSLSMVQGCKRSEIPSTSEASAHIEPIVPPTHARAYYEELKSTGGLDKFLSDSVCFDDDADSDNFFIYTEAQKLNGMLKGDTNSKPMSKTVAKILDKDNLLRLGYVKGIPWDDWEVLKRDGESWLSEPGPAGKYMIRVRLTIAAGTHRYRNSAEVLNHDHALLTEKSSYGRCENVF